MQAAVVSIYYDAACTEPPSYTQDFYLGYCVGSLGMTSCSSTLASWLGESVITYGHEQNRVPGK